MREFFSGWRRKAGCVTLVMAVAFTGEWFRSQCYCDRVYGPFRGVAYSLDSDNGALTFGREWDFDGDITEWCKIEWEIGARANGNPPDGFFSLKDGVFVWGDVGACRYQEIVISHLSIAIPLSLLSAYLLLWKPRKRKGAEHA